MKKGNKKILMVCYYYPPLTDVGCKRSVFFAKHFKDVGWNPYVLSVKNPDKTFCSLGSDLPPEGISVTYSFSLFSLYRFFGRLHGLLYLILRLCGIEVKKNFFYEYLCIPDIFIGWVPLAIVNGLRLIKKYDFDIVYVSVTPVSSAIIGWWLKKLTGKPLVLDYRDPFGVDITRYQPDFVSGWFRKYFDTWYARRVLGACDLFTVTTLETEQLYREQFSFLGKKIYTVYNGFDHELLDMLTIEQKKTKFTIIYTGEFYFQVAYEYFFEGLFLLKKQEIINKDNFQFLFYGDGGKRFRDILKKYEIEDFVILKERIAFVDVLKEIQRSHLQLLRLMQPMISTKLFEGIALNTPFLATIPPGEVEGIIRKYSPSSFLITDNKAVSVARSVEEAMKKYMQGTMEDNHVDDFLREFSRASGADNMLDLFERHLMGNEN